MRIVFKIAGSLACIATLAGPAVAADVASTQMDIPTPTAQPLNSAGEGRRQFLRLNCYGCHGMDAKGAIGPRITKRDRAVVAAALAGGRPGGMPSFAGIVREIDVTNITAYLASIGTPEEPKFNAWWQAIPPK